MTGPSSSLSVLCLYSDLCDQSCYLCLKCPLYINHRTTLFSFWCAVWPSENDGGQWGFLLMKKRVPLPNNSFNGLCNPRKTFLGTHLAIPLWITLLKELHRSSTDLDGWTGLSPPVFLYWPFQGGTSVVVLYCYLFLLSVFILWVSYYVSDIFCKF